MATHSRILGWRIPWTEEPGELQSTEGLKELNMTEVTQHALSTNHCIQRYSKACLNLDSMMSTG